MYIDMTYIVLVLPAVIFALLASANVNRTFKKYSGQYSQKNMTGADAARTVLQANGVYDVKVEQISGQLTDHYDPKTRTIRLSENVYANSSTAAIGVAAHEAGHALQHATDYAPLRIRNAIVPITNIGSRLSMPLIVLGLIFSQTAPFFVTIAYIGVACFGLCTLFQLVTLPTEFNASRRALQAIEESRILNDTELSGAKKVLTAAAMTYVAALAVSLTQLLRLLLIVSSRDRRR